MQFLVVFFNVYYDFQVLILGILVCMVSIFYYELFNWVIYYFFFLKGFDVCFYKRYFGRFLCFFKFNERAWWLIERI